MAVRRGVELGEDGEEWVREAMSLPLLDIGDALLAEVKVYELVSESSYFFQ